MASIFNGLKAKLSLKQLYHLSAVVLTCILIGCSNQTDAPANHETTNETTAPAPVSTTSSSGGSNEMVENPTAVLGNFSKQKLSCGVELNLPENGMERKMIAFIEDKTKPVDKTTWFTFDRLIFKSGSSDLDVAKSADQLRNIVEIMKCYPNVKIKIGGYTDNVGNKEDNLKLSANRANVVRATLVGLQVSPERMESEGFGDQYPVAPNDTEENKAKNRRIDVRITAK